MTIEFSLRRRANKARIIGLFLATFSVGLLFATVVVLPYIAERSVFPVSHGADAVAHTTSASAAFDEIATPSPNHALYSFLTLTLALSIISFACYLVSRCAFFELHASARLAGLADAFCVAGNDLAQLEKAAAILAPKPKSSGLADNLSSKDIQTLAEIVAKLK